MTASTKRISIVGGGPAGLYLAILLRTARPALEVDVFERNRPGDAFGFGVVFSDETLDHFAAADPKSFESLAAGFRSWGDIRVHHPIGRRFRSGGHGFSAMSRRVLLDTLGARAADVGARLSFSSEIPDISPVESADLVVGADGANSTIRRQRLAEFMPSVDMRSNKYIWFGTPRVYDEFNFVFVETPHGMVWAHIYPFGDEGSTFIVEMAVDTWSALGFAETQGEDLPPGVSDQRAIRGCEEIFADYLEGSMLLGNNSKWVNFPTITCERWSAGNVVLMGDAAHTAHFSVGSGTKLAMEDAIELAGRLLDDAALEDALVAYETRRRPEVESLQRAAKASLQWFEGVERYRFVEPEQFVFSLLTRSQRITYDNLRLRDPLYAKQVDEWYASSDHRCPVSVSSDVPPMFHPFKARGLVLPNRIVVSPMDQYSSVDGLPNDWHLVHLGSRAVGGAGLVMTEMTCVSPNGRISPGCTGIWNDDQLGAWERIVAFVHGMTPAKIGLQIGHSGRKGSTKLMWEGDSDPLDSGNWEIMGPSPIPYRPDSQVPREMHRGDMDRVLEDHVDAARRGVEAGFDLLELHFAHGYLLSSFLTPLANQRHDEYGGTLENRMRYPLEVFASVRAVWPGDKPMSVRISATDWVGGGFEGNDAVVFSAALKELGCDLIDVSSGQTSVDADPEYGRLYQTPFSDRIRNEVGIATMTVGAVSSIDDVNTILVAGRADLCVLARPHLVDPYWTLNAAIDQGYAGHPFPPQYLSGLGARRREQGPIPPDIFRQG